MKPDINQSLMILAQELIQRFSPLLHEEYEQSRLNSLAALIILGSINLDKEIANLSDHNKLIEKWLSKSLVQIHDSELKEELVKYCLLEKIVLLMQLLIHVISFLKRI